MIVVGEVMLTTSGSDVRACIDLGTPAETIGSKNKDEENDSEQACKTPSQDLTQSQLISVQNDFNCAQYCE